MSKNFNLKDFQNQLTSKLQSPDARMMGNSLLGFRVAGLNWLINLEDINEVLPVPAILAVPGTKRWFRGVANIRGNLYAVSDLGDYLSGNPTPESGHNRLLLAHNRLGANVALLVDQTLGLKHPAQLMQDAGHPEQEFVSRLFHDEQAQRWAEIRFATLIATPAFMAAEAET
jgi:twitching motility protein PilI